jgi:hypothetical protein
MLPFKLVLNTTTHKKVSNYFCKYWVFPGYFIKYLVYIFLIFKNLSPLHK